MNKIKNTTYLFIPLLFIFTLNARGPFEEDINRAFGQYATSLAQELALIREDKESKALIEQQGKQQIAKIKQAESQQKYRRSSGRSAQSKYFTSKTPGRGGHQWSNRQSPYSSGRSFGSKSYGSSGGYKSKNYSGISSSRNYQTFNHKDSNTPSRSSSLDNNRSAQTQSKDKKDPSEKPPSSQSGSLSKDKKDADIKKNQLSESAKTLINQCKDLNKLMSQAAEKPNINTIYNNIINHQILYRLTSALKSYTSGLSGLHNDDAKSLKEKPEVQKQLKSTTPYLITLIFHDSPQIANTTEQQELLNTLQSEESKLFGNSDHIKKLVIQKEQSKMSQLTKEINIVLAKKDKNSEENKATLRALHGKLVTLDKKIPLSWAVQANERDRLIEKIIKVLNESPS